MGDIVFRTLNYKKFVTYQNKEEKRRMVKTQMPKRTNARMLNNIRAFVIF